jgi:hypothetical protein
MLFPLLLFYFCPSISSPFIFPDVIPRTSTILHIISYLILSYPTSLYFLTPTGGWYLMIVCGQAAHIWVCRTTTVSIFQHGVFTNKITNIGVGVALLLGCFVTYCPGKSTLQYCVQPSNSLPRPFLCLEDSLSYILPAFLFH